MDSSTTYPIPDGVDAIPHDELDLRSDAEVDYEIFNPKPITDEKNLWFFWNSGFQKMHGYHQRTVRNWHRRFSKKGWVVRLLDVEPGSSLNVANYLNVQDPEVFPKAFTEGTIGGRHVNQHISDLVRFPLLLRYGGVYADVGLVQIGDLDSVWNDTVGNPSSPFEILTYNTGSAQDRSMTNYFLASKRNNPFFLRCHKLLLTLWAGKTSTEGMHTSPLLKGLPLMDTGLSMEEDGITYGREETAKMLTDYIIQGHVVTMVMGLIDVEDGWDGPKYVAKHVYAYDYMIGSQHINELTAWNGPKQFELMSLQIPKDGEEESEDQRLARRIVEDCLAKSFGMKLATGMIIRVMGDTLSSLWRKHDGSDNIPGTYAHWLRHGTLYWCPKNHPAKTDLAEMPAFKIGPLLREGEVGPGACATTSGGRVPN
ncbi:hypothetical protein MKX08_005939 [Trichoderma sp. CBMAI-0020]|nr:hypothetical protein MKX08_005939 [Trichoderma sp. CBMAI-0020]